MYITHVTNLSEDTSLKRFLERLFWLCAHARSLVGCSRFWSPPRCLVYLFMELMLTLSLALNRIWKHLAWYLANLYFCMIWHDLPSSEFFRPVYKMILKMLLISLNFAIWERKMNTRSHKIRRLDQTLVGGQMCRLYSAVSLITSHFLIALWLSYIHVRSGRHVVKRLLYMCTSRRANWDPRKPYRPRHVKASLSLAPEQGLTPR